MEHQKLNEKEYCNSMNSDRIKKSGGFQNTNQKEKAVSEYL
jgi:hypothetical protein